MKTLKVSLFIVFLVTINLTGQNLIGYSEKEVRQFITENQKNLAFQNFINNNTFKYLKYTDKDDSQTVLFFLNDQLICKSIRLVCDKSLKTAKTNEYNSLFKKIGENKWTETKNGKSKDDDWSFNVTIKLNE
jgi:hypothetical protein